MEKMIRDKIKWENYDIVIQRKLYQEAYLAVKLWNGKDYEVTMEDINEVLNNSNWVNKTKELL